MWIGNWLGSIPGGGLPATPQDLADAIAASEAAQAAVDAAQDAMAAAEESDDDAVNAAQDAMIQAQAGLIAAAQTLINQVSAVAHDPAPQDAAISQAQTNIAAVQSSVTAAQAAITALQAVSHDGAPQDAAIASLQATVAALVNLLGSPPEVFDVTAPEAGNLTNVFDWNTSSYNDIQARDFYVSLDPDSAVPITELNVANGATETFYIVGPLYTNNAGAFSNIGGAEVEVTNTAGVLSYNLIGQQFTDATNWPGLTYNELTATNANVGEFRQASGDFLFQAGQGQGFVDIDQLHDGTVQDARLDAIETTLGAGTTSLSGVSIQNGTARAATILGRFTPTVTGPLVITYEAEFGSGNAGLVVTEQDTTAIGIGADINGTEFTALRNDAGVLFESPTNARPNIATPSREYTVNVTAGQPITFVAFAGGGSTVTSATVTYPTGQPVNLGFIHDPAPQDARLSDLEAEALATDQALQNIGSQLAQEATDRADGDTALDTRLSAVEAQLPDDDTALAQQVADNAALILAEAADQDTAEAQIQTLIAQAAANMAAANNAATAASANAAALTQEVADRTAGDTALQSQIDGLPDAYDDAPVVSRLDALELVSHDPQPQDDAHTDLVGLVGGSALVAPAPDTFTVLTAEPGNTDNLFIRPAVTNAGYRREHFHVSEDPAAIQNITSVVVPDGGTKDIFIVQGVYNIGLDQLTGKQKIYVRLTNTGGTLTHAILGRQVTGTTDWETSTYNSFSGSNTNDLEFAAGGFDWLFDGAMVASGSTVLQRLAIIESQLPDDDTGLAQLIADNAAALAAEIAATDGDVTTLLGQTAANLAATQTNTAAAATNAANITQEIADRQAADTALDSRTAALEALDPVLTSGAQTINGAKTFNEAVVLSNGGTVGARGLGVELVPSTGSNNLIVYPGSTEVGDSAYVRNLTQAGDSGNSLATKSYIDAQDSALDVRLAAVEAQLPDDDSGLAAQIAANAAALASEVSDTNADFITVLAQTAANQTATTTNAAAASANAAAITQEAADRAAADNAEATARTNADNALQSDIDTKDAQNVKITGAQNVAGVKTFTDNPIISSPGTRPAVLDIVGAADTNQQGILIYDSAPAVGAEVASLIRTKANDIFRMAKGAVAMSLRSNWADFNVPLVLSSHGNNTTDAGSIELREAQDNGNAGVILEAPAELANGYKLVLPDSVPAEGSVLKVVSVSGQDAVAEWQTPFICAIRAVVGDALNGTTTWNTIDFFSTVTQEIDDTDAFTDGTITVPDTARYRLKGYIRGTSTGQRVAVELSYEVNGTVDAANPIGSTGYIRAASGHNVASNHLETIVELSAGDLVRLVGRRDATAGTWTNTHYEFSLEKIL